MIRKDFLVVRFPARRARYEDTASRETPGFTARSLPNSPLWNEITCHTGALDTWQVNAEFGHSVSRLSKYKRAGGAPSEHLGLPLNLGSTSLFTVSAVESARWRGLGIEGSVLSILRDEFPVNCEPPGSI